MAYTSPMTYVAGAVLTAGQMNTYVRDNVLATAVAIVTTQGDTVYASAANTLARLAKGTAYQHLRINSGATAPEWTSAAVAPDVVTAETAVSTTAETTIYTFTVPGGTLGTNNVLLLTLFFKHAANNTAEFKGKYGGTTMTDITFTGSNMGASGSGAFHLYLKGDGATNAQEAVMAAEAGSTTSTTRVATGTAAIDSTTDQTLLVSVTLGGGTLTTLGSTLQLFNNL